MPLRSEPGLAAVARHSAAPPAGPARRAADVLREGQARERAGLLEEAVERYEVAIALAERHAEYTASAEALRRLAVVRHRQGDAVAARTLCRRSYVAARRVENDVLVGEAFNTLGGIELLSGSLKQARHHFLRALEWGGASRGLRARVEQNLGILANIQGNLEEALTRYGRSLDAYRASGDEHGCALAYHNLAMVSADRGMLDEADAYFAESRRIAECTGNVHLQGLCLLNQAEVHVARQRFEAAREGAELALDIFGRVGARAEQSGAYRIAGVVYRETGRPALAEAPLQLAIELAVAAGSVLNEAEASRELALVYQGLGRNQEALRLLNAAHRLFGQLDARRDLVHVEGKVSDLVRTYLAVVREWGQSIEMKDTYTFGHCERVARNAVAVACALGLDEEQQITIRLGAYLHDLGKLKIPHGILNKRGPLTESEFQVVARHPVWGVELLAGVDFPWDIKPIIRWHHEKYDGSGYPDGLRGDAIPLPAQIVGIVDVYDALTTDRPYRLGLTSAEACAEITKMRSAWSAPVFGAFLRALPDITREADGGDQAGPDRASRQAA